MKYCWGLRRSLKRCWDFCINCLATVGLVLLVYKLPSHPALCPISQHFLPSTSLPAQCRTALAPSTPSNPPTQLDPPTEAYQRQALEGFTVWIAPKLQQQESIASKALYSLGFALEELEQELSPEQLSKLKKVPIWLEFDSMNSGTGVDDPETEMIDDQTAGEYFSSAKWLRANGYNPDKAGGIGLYDMTEFIQYSLDQQVQLILHEFAHAYHYQILGAGHAGVRTAYQQAMNRKLYDAVKHNSGKKSRAYAATNPDEYFAELSVSYFAQNYYYPFNRAQLAKHDPIGYRLIETSWNQRS